MGCWCSAAMDEGVGDHYSEGYSGGRRGHTHDDQNGNAQGRFLNNPWLHMHRQYYRTNNYYQCVTSLAMAMYRAEQTAAAVAGVPNFSLSSQATDFLVRKAKAEGSTVKVIEDRLYIDYKYVGRLPKDAIVNN